MPTIELQGFIGPSYVAQSITADGEDAINLYFEPVQAPAPPARGALYPTPGVVELSEGMQGPGRAHVFFANREFAVIGSEFVEIDAAGTTITSHGTVATDSNPATISYNGDGGGELFITSGSNGYLFTLATDTFAAIATLAGEATMGASLDGYFISLDSSTSTIRISDLLDGATWDPTQFAQRSIASDPWVSVIVSNRYIYLLGSETSEVWYDAGAFPFPFQPHPSGTLIQYGCAAPFSPQVVTGSMCWLGKTTSGEGVILRISGFQPEVISNFAIQNAINGYRSISDAIGDSYDDLGHTFYLLYFPQGNITWTWDSQVPGFHKRGTWITEDNEYIAWRPIHHAFAWGEHRMLDRETASVYRMSSDYLTDVDDREIRRLRRAPGIVDKNRRLFYSNFELYMESGLGTSTGQGSNPQVMLRHSNDGGFNWSNERWESAGAIGQYGKRVEWHRLGSGRRRVFEVVMTDPIPWRLMGAFVEVE